MTFSSEFLKKRKMFPPKADPETCALRTNICNILTQSATQTELVELVNSTTESDNAIRKRRFLCFEGTIFVLL